MKNSNNLIEDFSWDKEDKEFSFFGENEENPIFAGKEEEGDDEEGKDTEEPDKKDKAPKEEKTDEVFSDFEIEEEENEEDDNEDSEDPPAKGKTKGKGDARGEEEDSDEESSPQGKTVSTLNFLKEKGIIEFEDLEEELTEEEAELLLEDKFEEAVEARFEEALKGLPKEVKSLVKFATNGGDVNKMLSDLSKAKASGISENLDLTEEENQIAIVRHQLEKEGYDEDYISSNIEFLQDSGRLEKVAETKFKVWKKEQDELTEARIAAQKEEIRKNRQKQIEYKKELEEVLQETESINNLKFTKKDIKDLPDYISTPSVKTQQGGVITPMWRDLVEAMKDKDKLLLLAKLVKNGFDFKDLEKAIETKQTRKIKENLQRQEKSKKINSARGSSQKPKRLADYF